jgi:hypothetical protein
MGMVMPREGESYALEVSHCDKEVFQIFLDHANQDIEFQRPRWGWRRRRPPQTRGELPHANPLPLSDPHPNPLPAGEGGRRPGEGI